MTKWFPNQMIHAAIWISPLRQAQGRDFRKTFRRNGPAPAETGPVWISGGNLRCKLVRKIQRCNRFQRRDPMHSGIQSAWAGPRGLAHSDAAHPAGHHRDALSKNERQPGPEDRPLGSSPVQLRFDRSVVLPAARNARQGLRLRSYMEPLPAVVLDDLGQIVQRDS